LGRFEVDETGTAVIKLGMDNGGCDSGSSFKVKHGLNAAEVTDRLDVQRLWTNCPGRLHRGQVTAFTAQDDAAVDESHRW